MRQHRQAHDEAEAAVYEAAKRAGLGGGRGAASRKKNKKQEGQEAEAVAGLVALAQETEDEDV